MEAEREKFRAYVEKTGLMSALTKSLLTLYESHEKPTDSVAFVLNALGKEYPVEHYKILEQKCLLLEEENNRLREELRIARQVSENTPLTPVSPPVADAANPSTKSPDS